MMTLNKETAIKKIIEMPVERVSKVLIFMAGMEAEHSVYEKCETMLAVEHQQETRLES